MVLWCDAGVLGIDMGIPPAADALRLQDDEMDGILSDRMRDVCVGRQPDRLGRSASHASPETDKEADPHPPREGAHLVHMGLDSDWPRL